MSFKVQPAGGSYFAIVPPAVNPEMENSLLRSLSTVAAPRVQNGHWMFPLQSYEAVRTSLGMSVDMLSSGNPMYSPSILDSVAEQPSNTGHSQASAPQSAVDLDLGALGAEVDEQFGTNGPGFVR